MSLVRALAAIMAAVWFSAAAAPLAAQDAKVDVRKITCSELDVADNGDRVAAIFFFYGYHAALLKVVEVSPANLERNVKGIVKYCLDNPTMPIFEAVPKAFQR